MLSKEKVEIAFFILVAILSSCSIVTPSTQTTITPITVSTLSAFNSPEPTITAPPTSTRDPRPTATFAPTPTLSGTLTFTPTLIVTAVNPPVRSPKIDFPSNLELAEYELTKDSGFSRLSFTSVQGTDEQIMARYKNIYSYDVFPSPLIQGYYQRVMLNGYELVAEEEVVDQKSIIHIFYDGKEISRVDAGHPYTSPNILGLWTYQNHWIMEYINVFENPHGRGYTLGNIIWDGESLNAKYGYQESFGLTAIDGRILYFFRRNDRFGISYDGAEYNLDYETVLYNRCCEIGLYVNPKAIGTGYQLNQNLGFFAKRNGIKYFVVISTK